MTFDPARGTYTPVPPSSPAARERLVSQLRGLPPIPQSLIHIWKLVDDPDTSVADLSQAICSDPPLVATVLKLANSAAYARTRGVTTVSEAAMLMGFDTIKKVCMSALAQSGPMASNGDGTGFDRLLYWRHSVGTGLAAEALSEILRLPWRAQSFSHGLLHDIGVLAMDRCMPGELGPLYKARDEENRPLMELESERLGINHAELGAELARQWKFPASMVQVIANHAQPPYQSGHNLEVIVHLACRLTDQQECCQLGDPERTFERACHFLEISKAQLESARTLVSRRLTALAEAFEL